jgi:wobble nucleotide-excising tRNase
MISSISIRKYKSFHPTNPTNITFAVNPAKPVFMYGLNGAGKSAIGEVIYRAGLRDESVNQCTVTTTGEGPFRNLVYNHEFVERAIGQAAGMPGIFTLGEIDTETQRTIEALVVESAQLETTRAALQDPIQTTKDSMDSTTEAAVTGVWKAHTDHADGPLGELLRGYGRDRRKFVNDLRTFAVPDDLVLPGLEELTQRWADVSGDAAAKELLRVDFTGLDNIELDPIWAEPIEVSGSSRLAPLIERLRNSDWVGAGRRYIQGDKCPFCQQDLPSDFTDQLAKLLDGDRKVKLEHVRALAQAYERRALEIDQAMGRALQEPLASRSKMLHEAWELAWARIRLNLSSMRNKMEKPGDQVEVERVNTTDMQQTLAAINTDIEAFNKRVADRETEKKLVRTAFWRLLCRDRMAVYLAYDSAMAPLNEALKRLQQEDGDAAAQVAGITAGLAELRRNQTGVDASVLAINARLLNMGIDSFSIIRKPGEGSLYCLARPGQVDVAMNSLSEGEKTLISFLYYMEMLKGSNDDGNVPSMGKTVVVIDDPISSLSVNYVFDIASTIHHELIKQDEQGRAKVRQVIVLTHNLFFLHELLKLSSGKLATAEKRCQLLRVTKQQHTKVLPMLAKDLMNDYDSLWQVLRDARDGNVPAIMVPNTMRCILELFFSFTQKEDEFASALAALEIDVKFVALSRFLNRGSHKDGINMTVMDYAQYDVPYYLEKFQAVFDQAGFPDHFTLRMGGAPPNDREAVRVA